MWWHRAYSPKPEFIIYVKRLERELGFEPSWFDDEPLLGEPQDVSNADAILKEMYTTPSVEQKNHKVPIFSHKDKVNVAYRGSGGQVHLSWYDPSDNRLHSQ